MLDEVVSVINARFFDPTIGLLRDGYDRVRLHRLYVGAANMHGVEGSRRFDATGDRAG